MEAATNEKLNDWADSEELKRFCIIFGVRQSNAIYRILSANDKAEMIERVKEETKSIKLSMRGGGKCSDGKVWDEARQECV